MPPPGWRFDDVEVRADERRVLRGGIAQPLGLRAFDLLRLLIERRGQVVTKDELMLWVWPGLVVEENNLTVQISALRKAIGAKAIRTVPGRGYQLAVDAVAIGPMEPSAVGELAGNLPAQATCALGRNEELAAVLSLLADARMVTLTGVGGIGKTRLGPQAASAFGSTAFRSPSSWPQPAFVR